MKYLSPILLCIFLLGAGCSFSDEPSPAVSEGEAVTELTQEPDTEASVTQKPPSTSSNQGVYGHSVWLARSSDAETWTLDDEELIEHASVPNITRFEKAVGDFEAGTLMIVYVDATEIASAGNGTERTGRYVSTDNGETWEDIGPVTYENADGHVPVDPNLIQLADGTLRMYYFDFSQSVGGVVVADEGGTSQFYAADSTDGETFTVVGEVFSGDRLTDPEVINYNGTFYLFYASQAPENLGIHVAIGDEEGLTFEETEISGDPLGIPGIIEIDGELRLFGCAPSEGIGYYVGDDSFDFGELVSLGSAFKGGFCDPDPVELEDGSYLLVVKKAQPMQPKQP